MAKEKGFLSIGKKIRERRLVFSFLFYIYSAWYKNEIHTSSLEMLKGAIRSKPRIKHELYFFSRNRVRKDDKDKRIL